MVAVALRAATEHFPGEQRLAPKRDKALRIEILRVKRPQSHGVASGLTIESTGAPPHGE